MSVVFLLAMFTCIVDCFLHEKPVPGRRRVAVRLHSDMFAGTGWAGDESALNAHVSPKRVAQLAQLHGYRSLGAVANLHDHFLFEEIGTGTVKNATRVIQEMKRRRRRRKRAGVSNVDDSAASAAADVVTSLSSSSSMSVIDEDMVDLSGDSGHLHDHQWVLLHEEQIARRLHKRASVELPPQDPLFNQQWHLRASDKYSIRAEGAWDMDIFGRGAQVAIVDDGLQFTHPDIAANFDDAGSYDFNDHDEDVTPNGAVRPGGFVDDHGTPAGGLCCAVNNGKAVGVDGKSFCGVGAAMLARVAGLRILGADTADSQEAEGVSFAPDKNDIYSNSWGPCDNCALIEGPRTLAKAAIEKNMQIGRGGKGSIYVWAAGNGRSRGDNCNNDGWANWRYTVTIAGITDRGKIAYYSEFCSALHVSVPGGGSGPSLTTTDLLGSKGQSSGDCMSSFSGTSAAAPVAAGVVALILEANSKLGWRDVQAVLIKSALMIDENEGDWQTNGAGRRYSHKYGFGMINAEGAVKLAKSWVPWPAEQAHNSTTNNIEKTLVGGAPLLRDSIRMDIPAGHVVEHVEIFVNIQHPTRGSLSINLYSPSGTESRLHEPHSDSKRDIPPGWRFTSNANWAEEAGGEWRLEVLSTRGDGFWKSWTLCVYTHEDQSSNEPNL